MVSAATGRGARPRAPRRTCRRAPAPRTRPGTGWRGTPGRRRRRCRCRARRGRDVGDVTRAERPRLAVDPLLGAARDDVDDLFHRRVAVERVALARRHRHAHQHQLLGGGQAGPGQPLVRAPGRGLDDGVGGRHEAQRVVRRHRVVGGIIYFPARPTVHPPAHSRPVRRHLDNHQVVPSARVRNRRARDPVAVSSRRRSVAASSGVPANSTKNRAVPRAGLDTRCRLRVGVETYRHRRLRRGEVGDRPVQPPLPRRDVDARRGQCGRGCGSAPAASARSRR